MFCHVKNISYICGGFWCYYEPTKIQNGIIYGSIKKNIFTMVKKTFLIAALMLCGIGAMAQYNMSKAEGFKRHNFGLGANFGSFPLHKDYCEAIATHGWMTDIRVTSAFAWNVSFKYEYMFNKKFSLSAEAGYTNQRLGIRSDVYYPIPATGTSSHISEYSTMGIHQLYVPIMANYRLRVADCANFVIGAGINASLAFKDKFETKDLTGNVGVKFKNAVDMDFVLRAGFEIGSRHRMQVNATYMVSPMYNLEFYRGEYSSIFSAQEGDNVSRLMFGFTIFL